ncbi:hypothetical protein [Pontibacter akesuensis]|uniref:DKNYY family protein n=1 Tax=Pontibacter akesuensis TaxID=388950 RepID=A0A1I7G8A4_9BACT|nr:hypothetical protein [Pontibacter akesuensis]GHA58207.1 hypothetical protein GCM10007389_07580 [Pontibacter akesuensis]SFU44657.1 hypothetical protein SAMN04487941_0808 [Pontibacter akesuensis]
MKKALFLLVMVTALVTACEQSFVKPDPEAMGYAYYPLEVGSYRIYNVTDIRFKSDIGDTTRFQMRERIDTSFTDQTNALVYKVVRSIRPNEKSNWVDDSVYVVTRPNSMLLETKNNTPRVKLVFPVDEGTQWLGDAYNSNILSSYNRDQDRRSDYYRSKEPYTYKNVGEPYTLNGTTYQNSLTVIQGEPIETWVGLDDRKEVYVKDIGMVYRLYTRIVYCNETESINCEYAMGYKLFGHERHEELISYGKE